jgi:hypothetical protein
MFALLDRANIEFAVKGAIWDSVRRQDAASAILSVQSLDLSPDLLSAVSEVLLAQ